MVLGALGPPWFREFLYCVNDVECDTYVGVFEEIGNFSYFLAVVGKDCTSLFLFPSLSLSWHVVFLLYLYF